MTLLGKRRLPVTKPREVKFPLPSANNGIAPPACPSSMIALVAPLNPTTLLGSNVTGICRDHRVFWPSQGAIWKVIETLRVFAHMCV